MGFTTADPLEDARRHINARRESGHFGRMRFTMANPDVSCVPRSSMPQARSLVVGAISYGGGDDERPVDGTSARIARYARRDWYQDLRAALSETAQLLGDAGFRYEILADDNRLVDRAVAARAGIGHFGKNANLLTKKNGSWVLLGAILTEAPLEPDLPSDGTCGSCTRCIAECPTDAIIAPGVVDATRCIAYLLQCPDDASDEVKRAIGDRLYGCDDCQECCPVNARVASRGPGEAEGASGRLPPGEASIDAIALLEMSDREIVERVGRFYIPRRDPAFVRRNAMVVLGNSASSTAIPPLRVYLDHPNKMLRRHAEWAISEIVAALSVPDRVS